MKSEWWIAKRLYYTQQADGNRRSRPAVRVALWGIVIGVMVMVLTVCVVVGFKQTISSKVAGFGAHIQVVNFDNNNTYEMKPIAVKEALLADLGAINHVESAHTFVTKPGIIKTDSAFEGIVYKGIDYWTYFGTQVVEGRVPEKESEVLLSKAQAEGLGLKVGDKVMSYFVDEKLRVRKWEVSGIYETGLAEMDKVFVLGLPGVVKQLNNWEEEEVSGIEIVLDDMDNLAVVADEVYEKTMHEIDEEGYNVYYVQTLYERNGQIFAWLDLLDMNVVVILVLMVLVSGFTIVSGLIILILDGVKLIGVLKALGASNGYIRRVFIGQASLLIGKGMVWGNALGLGIAAVQYFTHCIPLEAATYYVNYVPMAFEWGWLIALNGGIMAVAVAVMILPSAIVAKISPAKVMHFE